MPMINIAPPVEPIPALICPESIQYGSKLLQLNVKSSHDGQFCMYYDEDKNEILVGEPFDATGKTHEQSMIFVGGQNAQ